jgi:hypothetical protein
MTIETQSNEGEAIDFHDELQRELERQNEIESKKHESNPKNNPFKFSPSQLGCRRQIYLKKCGLLETPLGIFKMGTMIHEFMEETMKRRLNNAQFEKSCFIEKDDIKFSGRFDCYDPDNRVIYDFKTKNSFYKYQPRDEQYLDQLTVYMAAVGVGRSKLVYISKNNLEIRQYPRSGFFRFDPDRFEDIIDRCTDVGLELMYKPIASSPNEIPFDGCTEENCRGCKYESLDF